MLDKVKSVLYSKKCKKDCKTKYLETYKDCKIDNNKILLEPGQGKNLNGNMFAFVREIMANNKWKHLNIDFVVTKSNINDAKSRFELYGFNGVNFVIRNSDEYIKSLATSKYLITDNSFPIYFIKKEEQIYLNTWHGTPLKYLGRSDLKNSTSIGNIQKNFLSANYILFPNEFTRDVFMNDYMLENIGNNKVLLCDYPRNEAFSNELMKKEIKKSMKLEDKELIAYMPTWRGSGRKANSKKQIKTIIEYLHEIDKNLKENQILYVNLHFLVTSSMDFSEFNKVKPFPKEYETYDFLNCCDILITDYSSVFFDYAIKEKKVILFAYDEEEYIEEKGTYFPLSDLPFPKVKNIDNLIEEINLKNHIDVKEFNNKYNNYIQDKVTEKILDLLVYDSETNLKIESPPRNNNKNILIHGGSLNNKIINTKILELIEKINDKNKNIILSFEDGLNKNKCDFLQILPENVNFISLVKSSCFNVFWNDVEVNLFEKNREALELEKKNIFCNIDFEEIIQMGLRRKKLAYVFAMYNSIKTAYFFPDMIEGFQYNSPKTKEIKRFEKEKFDHIEEIKIEELLKDERLNLNKTNVYNRCINITNHKSLFYNSKNKLNIIAICVIKASADLNKKKFVIKVQDKIYPLNILLKKGINIGKNRRVNLYHFSIPFEDCINLELHNKISLSYEDQDGYGFKKLIKIKKGATISAPVKLLKNKDLAMYFRKTGGNSLYITVRNANITDNYLEKFKISFAWILSKFIKSIDPILLFEKHAARYEESASVLYEKLIDMGYDNVYFILDKNCSYLSEIDSKYKKNIINKYSLKHYLYMFCCNTFISSESIAHACEVRTTNRLINNKLNDPKLNYVFLQHGVMYMVSLNSNSRKFFRKKNTKGLKRVVVSSEIEGKHFIDYANYNAEDIYICGLPKFDRNKWNKGANKIIIMPTWRPWEYNQARLNFTETKYYKMIIKILNSIPSKYKENVIVLPHPLIAESMLEIDDDILKYMNFEDKYDDLLKDAKVLITDYSSISYDAFYRGSNVIFYWEEKNYCMECYGGNTKLMLDEENCFGDICYNTEDLKNVFEKNYLEGQCEKYIQNYQKIVQFNDNKNTERLIEFLKEDKII